MQGFTFVQFERWKAHGELTVYSICQKNHYKSTKTDKKYWHIVILSPVFFLIEDRYYMAAQRYDILLKVFTRPVQQSSQILFNTSKEISYLRAAMLYSLYKAPIKCQIALILLRKVQFIM